VCYFGIQVAEGQARIGVLDKRASRSNSQRVVDSIDMVAVAKIVVNTQVPRSRTNLPGSWVWYPLGSSGPLICPFAGLIGAERPIFGKYVPIKF